MLSLTNCHTFKTLRIFLLITTKINNEDSPQSPCYHFTRDTQKTFMSTKGKIPHYLKLLINNINILPKFSIVDHTLMYLTPGQRSERVVLPNKLLDVVLQYYHVKSISAHMGITKTFSKYLWVKSLKDQIDKRVKTCPISAVQAGLEHQIVDTSGIQIALFKRSVL